MLLQTDRSEPNRPVATLPALRVKTCPLLQRKEGTQDRQTELVTEERLSILVLPKIRHPLAYERLDHHGAERSPREAFDTSAEHGKRDAGRRALKAAQK